MKKELILFLFFSLLCFNYSYPIFQQVEGIDDANIKIILTLSLKPNLAYIASKNSLYKSDDFLKTFNKVYVFKDEEIVYLLADLKLANVIYVATTRHIYKVEADKVSKIFLCPEEETIYSFSKFKDKFIVGTSNGLYISEENILKWHKLQSLLDVSVYFIEQTESGLFLATSKGVYFLDNDQNIKRLFVLRGRDEEEVGLISTVIKVDLFKKDRIWLGTTKGIYFSLNNGKDWEKLNIQTISNLSIRCLAQSNSETGTIYVGTDKGLFKINIEKLKVEQIFEGLSANLINWIQFDSNGKLYLATDKGLFKNEYFTEENNAILENILKEEPPIEEIQQQALKYNDVHPDKITKWRNMLKLRALLPTIRWDYDKTITYDSGSDRYFIGPRDWGLSFSWNMGDLLWNSYEDDVDTRSRLNTQLRLDILDEINRIYFERLRLKRQLLDNSLNEDELFQKQLRFKELTAMLDGYTGGYFSKRLKNLKGD